ncbi:hypothetical protein HID58_000316 [Brassica napus]|uniref:Uncharacterized protein n=1 Tax=Brassica napus TaxID=3708 RepID=A0ABQ8EG62_BRANA|nr:hypothetical protein HID58_000316 [Brassica napus]
MTRTKPNKETKPNIQETEDLNNGPHLKTFMGKQPNKGNRRGRPPRVRSTHDSKTRVKPETTTSSGKKPNATGSSFQKKPSSIDSKYSDHRRLKSRVSGEVKNLNRRSNQNRRKRRYSAAEFRRQSRRSRCYRSHRFPESKAGRPSKEHMRRRKQGSVGNTETGKPKKKKTSNSLILRTNFKPSEIFFFDKKVEEFERTNLSLREERENPRFTVFWS